MCAGKTKISQNATKCVVDLEFSWRFFFDREKRDRNFLWSLRTVGWGRRKGWPDQKQRWVPRWVDRTHPSPATLDAPLRRVFQSVDVYTSQSPPTTVITSPLDQSFCASFWLGSLCFPSSLFLFFHVFPFSSVSFLLFRPSFLFPERVSSLWGLEWISRQGRSVHYS